MPADVAAVGSAVHEISMLWRNDRAARLPRRHLERGDFDDLRSTGLLAMPAPMSNGGSWAGVSSSLRPLCEIYRCLGSADSSVALVSVMHPSVIAFWLASPDDSQPEWEAQREAVFASAVAGQQWGTITSEPGSGGDIAKTRATAERIGERETLIGETYAVTGDKHFGSGSGITDRMITTAVPEGESDPTFFVLDVRNRPWDGTAGLRLLAEWDGVGMAATQSHAMRLEAAPAVRFAFNGPFDAVTRAAGPIVAVLFTSVILGVLDEAISLGRTEITKRSEQLRAFEQVEWSRAEQAHWLSIQAYEGALRAIELDGSAAGFYAALRAKEAVAELAEDSLLRLTRVLGGGTFSLRSPFAHWFEDVRALGFLRPPWGLAFDNLFITSLESPS